MILPSFEPSMTSLNHLPHMPSLCPCSLLTLLHRWSSSQAGPRPCRNSRNSSSPSESTSSPSDWNSSGPDNPNHVTDLVESPLGWGSRRVATTTSADLTCSLACRCASLLSPTSARRFWLSSPSCAAAISSKALLQRFPLLPFPTQTRGKKGRGETGSSPFPLFPFPLFPD